MSWITTKCYISIVPVNTGGVNQLSRLTVLVIVAVLPQASVAVKVLTCDLKHPFEL